MLIAIPPLSLHGHIGMGPGLVAFILLIWLLIFLAIAAAVVNLVALMRPAAKPPRFMIWTIASGFVSLLVTAGGFFLGNDAPHELNLPFLLGGLLLLAITIGAHLRVRALGANP